MNTNRNFFSFGSKLRAMRALHGLNQWELAEKSGVSRYDIIQFENDKTLPGPQAKAALEAVFDVNFDDPIIIPVEMPVPEVVNV